jgi:two-component system, NarL family, response regulator NreC
VRHSMLIADDSAQARQLIRDILVPLELELCEEARDGEEAVQKARSSSPNLVILDMSMPRMNGVEAARRILEAAPGTSVLAISAYDPQPYLGYLRGLGVRGCVRKDWVHTDLVPAVEALLMGKTYFTPAERWLSLADVALEDGAIEERKGSSAP